ncbi:MAB_1171c family putative transporter [Streptomyces griseosporeus]|uniref:MAB_1171c family putative transporter n=1 Tax=Streptomyces griseosporeus TaxID=1910 RepID=UPI00167DC1FE|nr:MAB_1171c family putative transporter [Streptomyces griseosporeus]
MRPYELVMLPPMWLLTLYGVGRWRSAPRRNRVLSTMWLCWTLAVTLGTPAVRRVVDAVLGVASVTNLLVHLLGLTATAAVLEFIREVTGQARGRVSRWNLAGLAAGAATLAVAFAVMPRPDGEVDLLTYSQDSTAGYVYWTVQTGYSAIGLLVSAWVCWTHGRYAVPGPARISLRLMRVAIAADAVYLLHRFTYVTARHLRWPVPDSAVVTGTTQALLGLSWLLFALAVIWPALAEHRLRRAAARQADGIAPLWRMLQTGAPGVVLPLPDELRRNHPRLRLYRYVVEIQDGVLHLERHLDASHPPAAEAELRAAGVDETLLAPAVEAVLLRYALEAELAGRREVPGDRPKGPGAPDLDAEIRWLTQVAAAMEAPAVAAAARRLGETPTVAR